MQFQYNVNFGVPIYNKSAMVQVMVRRQAITWANDDWVCWRRIDAYMYTNHPVTKDKLTWLSPLSAFVSGQLSHAGATLKYR